MNSQCIIGKAVVFPDQISRIISTGNRYFDLLRRFLFLDLMSVIYAGLANFAPRRYFQAYTSKEKW